MIDIEVPTTVLKAVSAVAPKKDAREYLVSVCLDMGADGAHLVATDGVVLAAVKISAESFPPESVTIPVSLVTQVKAKAKNEFVRVVVQDREPGETGARKIMLAVGGAEYSAAEIEGTYPDWRRVIPKDLAGGVAVFAPGVVRKAMQFWESLGAGVVEIMFNGPECVARVEGRCSAWSEDATFIMMPCRR